MKCPVSTPSAAGSSIFTRRNLRNRCASNFSGDTIESIRAFDPNTQRSTNPVERATLLPLTEFPRHAEVLERVRVSSASGREDDATPAGFYPGWEFREALREDRKSTLFDLAV